MRAAPYAYTPSVLEVKATLKIFFIIAWFCYMSISIPPHSEANPVEILLAIHTVIKLIFRCFEIVCKPSGTKVVDDFRGEKVH